MKTLLIFPILFFSFAIASSQVVNKKVLKGNEIVVEKENYLINSDKMNCNFSETKFVLTTNSKAVSFFGIDIFLKSAIISTSGKFNLDIIPDRDGFLAQINIPVKIFSISTNFVVHYK
jgi:hypothetical protein